MPLIARVLVLFAPLYWLCPCDMNPDFLPGGYADDLWIVPLVVFLAIKLVPKAVILDARTATAQAFCGIVCLGLTVLPSAQPESVASVSAGRCISSSRADSFASSQKIHEQMAKCQLSAETAAVVAGTVQTCKSNFAFPTRPICREYAVRLASAGIQLDQRLTGWFLVTRGGQAQLYGTDGDAPTATASLRADNPTQLVKFAVCSRRRLFSDKYFRLHENWHYRTQTKEDDSSVEVAAC